MPYKMASFQLTLTFLLALLSTTSSQLTDPATLAASIKYDKTWSLLPWCINQCLWDNGDDDTPAIGGDIALHLSCGAPYPNGCYCRPQSATFINSFITSCASYLCTTPADADITSGTSVYAGYCSQALGAAYNPDATATTKDAPPLPSSLPSSPTVRPTTAGTGPVTTGPSSSPSSSNSNSNNENSTKNDESDKDEKIAGLSKGAFIGVVVSCTCSVLGLLFGAGFKIYKHRKNQRLERERIQNVQINYQPKV